MPFSFSRSGGALAGVRLRPDARGTAAVARFATIRRTLRAVHGSVAAWTWAPLLLRAVFVLVALFVFAWIGRPSARAAAEESSRTTPAVEPNAATPVTVATATASAPPSVPAPRSARASPSDPVYVNDAGEEELRRLPGVGPKRAASILAMRARVGRFRRIEDLLRIKGIGRKTIQKWRPLVRLEPRPSPDSPDSQGTGEGTTPRSDATSAPITPPRSL